MQDKVAVRGPMTITEFLAFYEERPPGEKWELIEGEPVMSSSPTDWHQVIVGNIYMSLGNAKLATGTRWVPAVGMSTCVPASPRSLPEPGVMVFEHPLGARRAIVDEAPVLFEVISDSNTAKDQAWRRRVYASVPNCQHYVTVDLRSVASSRYDRSTDWSAGARIDSLDGMLPLPALGIETPLAAIYRWTPLAGATTTS